MISFSEKNKYGQTPKEVHDLCVLWSCNKAQGSWAHGNQDQDVTNHGHWAAKRNIRSGCGLLRLLVRVENSWLLLWNWTHKSFFLCPHYQFISVHILRTVSLLSLYSCEVSYIISRFINYSIIIANYLCPNAHNKNWSPHFSCGKIGG